nr:copper resistance protein CopC [Micromonospora sp. DSM 115978]
MTDNRPMRNAESRTTAAVRVVPRTVLALFVLLAGGLIGLAGPVSPAGAHAAIAATTPEKNAVLGSAPTEVTLTFTEPVRPVTGRVQVLAPDGKRVNDGEPTVRGAVLRIPIRAADNSLGTYLVSYRVISADSHPIGGAYTFAVGAPSASAPELPDHDVHPSVRAAAPVAKYLGYAGLALLAGPALFLALLWPRRPPRTGAVRLVRAGVALVAAGTLGSIWLQAPFTSAAPAYDVSPLELWQVLDSRFGLVLLARLGLLLMGTALLWPVLTGRAEGGRTEDGRGRARAGRYRVGAGRATLLIIIGLGLAATWPLAGHAVAAPVPLASVLADTVHVAAMAVWLGGLVTLLALLLPRAQPRTLGVILPVWSRWATIAMVWLIGGGLVQALMEVGSIDALIDSTYGRLILGKVGLLAVALAAAGYARRTVLARSVPAAESWDRPARRLVRKLVTVEVGATAVVLGLTAVLAQTTPGRQAGIAAAEARLDAFAQTLESPLYVLSFSIYPVQLGESNTVHAFAYTAQGQPVTVEEWTVTTRLPAKDVEPVSTLMLGVEANQAIGALNFPIPGEWEVRFTLRTSEIDQATVTTTVPVS